MAGDWIPATKSLSRKREVLAISAQTSRSRYEVVGILLEFWSWVDDESDDGQLLGMTTGQLTELFPGTDDAFWRAVLSTGWLIQRSTALEVPNFHRWLGRSAKRRLKEAERKRNARQTSAKPVRKMSASHADKNGTTEQNRTEQNRKRDPPNPPKGGVEFPSSLDTSRFREAWGRWEQYRKETRHALRDSTRKAQLEKLAAWGEEKAIAALLESITNGWQGLFEPRADKPTNGKTPFQQSLERAMEEVKCRQSGNPGSSTTPPSSP